MFQKLRVILALVLLSGLTLTWIFRTKVYSETRLAMGTMCEITVYYRGRPPLDSVNRAFDVIKNIESLLSRFLSESEISRINRYEDFEPSIHTIRVVKEAMRIGDISDGAFDITCGPLMNVWKDFREETCPEPAVIDSARNLVNYKAIDTTEGRIRLKEGMKIDLSGLAKGYACELAADSLRQYGVSAGFVNCGGDIRAFGDREFKIGIRHPREEGIIYTAKIRNESIVTSGDYESYFEKEGKRFHHVIDPSTGYPANGCISVTVVTDNAMTADGLSTSLMVMGIDRGDSLLNNIGNVRGLLIDVVGDSMVCAGNLDVEAYPRPVSLP